MLYDVFQLRTAIEKSAATFDKEKAQERLSKLSGGVAVFKVCYLAFCLAAVLQQILLFILISKRLKFATNPSGWRG